MQMCLTKINLILDNKLCYLLAKKNIFGKYIWDYDPI